MKQIVIEIDDDYFELLVHDVECGNDYKPLKIIANGKPLPEGLIEKYKAESKDKEQE